MSFRAMRMLGTLMETPEHGTRPVDNTGPEFAILNEIRKKERELELERKREHKQEQQREVEEQNFNGNKQLFGDNSHVETGRQHNLVGGVLSTHGSTYNALNHPEFAMDIDSINSTPIRLNEGNLSKLDINLESGSQFNLSYSKSKNMDINNSNMDFSITSWQNISNYFDESFGGSESKRKEFNSTPTNEGSNVISSGSNSPIYLNDDILVGTINRTVSPNACSILSSSSGQDEDKIVDALFTRRKDNSNQARYVLGEPLLDPDHAGSDTELDKTIDSSTIISSFVMPKVSVFSKSNLLTENIYSKNFTRIKIVGDKDNILLSRFQSYKKTLTNIEFFSITKEAADLIILVVDEDNYMLPSISNTYCIPIVLSKSKQNLTKRIPRHLKLCEPIVLKSLNDSLINLVEFLSNINDVSFWKTFIFSIENNTLEKLHNNSLSDLNSSILGLQSRRNSEIEKLTNSDDYDKGKKLPNYYSAQVYVIAGIAIGAISVGILLFLQTITENDIIIDRVEQTESMLSYTPPDIKQAKHFTFAINEYLMVGFKELHNNIKECLSDFVSKSVLYYFKTKIAIVQYFLW